MDKQGPSLSVDGFQACLDVLEKLEYCDESSLISAQYDADGLNPWEAEFASSVISEIEDKLRQSGSMILCALKEQNFLGALFVMVTVASAFSDSIIWWNRVVKTADRTIATVAVSLSPVRAIFVLPPTLRKVVMLLLVASLGSLAWSRRSKNMSEFRTRHSVWHAVSAIGLTYLATIDPGYDMLTTYEFLSGFAEGQPLSASTI
ncbi:hypothetical protein NDN08_001155 [Rhodosorus marinus]|uniref:Uncharacterized protein n=1 Tax=Rhodosorus marinus TaxID=101924 RepID=A0AAV8UTM8_9RHOD|nr:hypothetical protein NDN08_001155 [Rhodosorus marinus]